jgi:hypothetical protein
LQEVIPMIIGFEDTTATRTSVHYVVPGVFELNS